MKSFEEYISDFLKGVAFTVDVDYANPASVKKSNRGVDFYRKSAVLIDKHYPERIGEFAGLMESRLPKVSICCAVSLLDLTEHYTQSHETRALEVITDTMKRSDSAEKYGREVWLKNWEKRKNNIKTCSV